MKKYIFRLLLAVIVFLYSSSVQAQCAMCRASLESNVSTGEATSMGAKLNLGIVYLFVTPYLLFGLLAFLWYRTSKKNGKRFNPESYYKG